MPWPVRHEVSKMVRSGFTDQALARITATSAFV